MGKDNSRAGNKSDSEQQLSPAERVVGEQKFADRYVPSAETVMDALISTDKPRPKRLSTGGTALNQAKSSTKKSEQHFPGAETGSRKRDDLPQLMIVLGVLCFVLALGLLYCHFLDPFGPHSTQKAVSSVPSAKVPEVTAVAPGVGAVTQSNELLDELGVTPAPEESKVASLPPIKVFVVGAVGKPGVVEVPFESRVEDAIKAAGGLSSDADMESVNLAQRLSDEDKIVVLRQGQKADPSGAKSSFALAGEDFRHKESSTSSRKATSDANAVAESGVVVKVNINTASQSELRKLKGVGPTIAEAIVSYRDNLPNHTFQSPEQLLNVAGIGPSKLEGMREQIEL